MDIKNVAGLNCVNDLLDLSNVKNDPEACALDALSHQVRPYECSSTFFYDPNGGYCKCVKKNKHCEIKHSATSNRYRFFKSIVNNL